MPQPGRWDTNFSNFAGFSLAGVPYVWAYRSSDGTVCIHQINPGGSGFTQKFMYQWDTAFSGFAAVSDASGNDYVWAYRASDGRVCIHQINAGGNGFTQNYLANWKASFSSFAGLSLAGIPYIWAYNASDGTVYIHQIDAGGSGFTQQYLYKWDTGFLSFTEFSLAGVPYVWAYRQGDGRVCIHQINPGVVPRPLSPMATIEHVFVVMLENRSFDNMFAMSGIPGIIHATTANANTYNGTAYSVRSNAPISLLTDPGHEFLDTLEQLGGPGSIYPVGGPYPSIQNSGFAANYATTTSEGPTPPPADVGDIMACFNTQAQLPVLYQLATQFAVCDQWFSSLPGPTWPNRFFVHGASSAGLDHSPTTREMAEWETVDGFVYPNGSIFDSLN